MKQLYISLMAQALSAYTDEHIVRYFEQVKAEGLTEHGFPRLTANIGILISHGIRTDILPLFCQMMDLCCEQIPRVKAANDFSVKEIIFCLMELERAHTLPSEVIARWKALLGTIDPLTCYNKYALLPTDKLNNWACFTAVSEFMRLHIGLDASIEFIDTQIASQLLPIDSNGMYRDPHEPIVYDLVPRGLFALLLHFGYNGQYRASIDECLHRAGIYTLNMQSVTGEIAYGGRSNQFLFNEALIAIVFEYEATRYAKQGELELAKRFKAGTMRALEATRRYLAEKPTYHVKNRFSLESHYGCEKYAYFDKYMITAASYLYAAYLLCDDSIPSRSVPESCAWQTSEHFHKVFMKYGDYSLEFDTAADPQYDANGLGRVHKYGAPPAICMSLPCTATPKYKIDINDAKALSLCPAILRNEKWQFATDSGVIHEVLSLDKTDTNVSSEILCRFEGGECVKTKYKLSNNGIEITVMGPGDIGYMLPAFSFDGQIKTAITSLPNMLEIAYMGWICRYSTNSTVFETDRAARNRNGHYRTFLVRGKNEINIKIEIVKNN